MYDNLCPSCGKGIVRSTELHNLRMKQLDQDDYIIPKAIIGICNNCFEIFVDYFEKMRWWKEVRKVDNGKTDQKTEQLDSKRA